ncbi:hypothetical protein K490DRAFT_46154 [Saccharata proteae CBS 121410]|uniref:Fanconi-associated nuclease n=1 Tax=Saccharata proteae CBS 121410 TaxID=1314787 RepID=A0A9P4HPT2_9PEZI|nr:hypothetical protein K490DRAFT_46154 [Saccharata proteae CBS 121410]
MALSPHQPAKRDQMRGKLIRHPKSTGFDDDEDDDGGDGGRVVPDSETGSGDEEVEEGDDDDAEGEADRPVQTDLETALPPIRTDKEAIEAYEASRAAEEAGSTAEGRLGERKWVKGKSSIYVDAFNLALETVLEEESHLFDEKEMEVFGGWRGLSYEAQYLYVRLFLRKTAAWHRIGSLGYHGDIADIDQAIRDLQSLRHLPESTQEPQNNPGELEPPEGTTLGSSFTFADKSDDFINTLEEASSLLKLDELRNLAKDAKVQGKNKKDLLKAFRRTSQKQTGLGFVGLYRSDTEASTKSEGLYDDEDGRTGTPRPEDANRDSHWIRKIMAETGPCIRLSLATLKLFERVHLVFYRSTEWTEKSLTTIILARIARRNFPEYIVSRSANIFDSRHSLLEFEASLRTQFRIDNILEFNGTPTKTGFQEILDVFEEVYPRWLILLKEEQAKENSIYHSGEGAYLRRLSPAWVYTRIVHKAAFVIGKLKDHAREHSLLTELLTQRLFHASRRGQWYQRKALLEEHYMATLSPSEGRNNDAQSKHWKRIALRTCEDGLQDPLVHLIHHYDLQKRVTKLERSLKIAKRFQHSFAHVRLAAPIETTVQGIQIVREPTTALKRSTSNSRTSSPFPTRRSTKTIWLDPAPSNPNAQVSVEEMCLSHYRSQGWKGYHCESGILRTLFAYLFYDILFLYVPHVFQTPFQTCPLDLHTDGFYAARLSEINARLAALANGEGAAILRRVWEQHEGRRTCVVGLDWGFEIEDLVEIVRAFGGVALGVVCQVLAQEYGSRGGGVPDLFLWRVGEGGGEVCFAEVKSENDRLSDTQRLWIHVLSGAGVRVELCNAVAKEVRVVE